MNFLTSSRIASRLSWSAIATIAVALLLGACSSADRGSGRESVAVAQQRLSCGSGGAGGSSATADSDPGALVVDMGTTPQTQGNALKPYGMVFDLVKNAKVPVLWAYNTSKAANTDVDFTVDGRSFRGSSFVIPGAFMATAQATVNKWVAQGVSVYGPTRSAFAPPTYYKRITGFPNIVLDPQNGPIAQAYLTAAGFPIFPVQYPTALNVCQDMFILPHADPTWANHGNLKAFVSNGGFLWVGCHAASVLEELDGNGDGIPDMDFLSSSGLINYANHVNAYPPYNYDSTSLADPVMQFLGVVDSAVSGGSEAVYLPYRGGSWRPTTKVSIWDPDQADVTSAKSPGLAAKIAYGRGYGLPSSGIVMYQGSHNFAGASADQIASQRAFLNLVLWNASEKSVVVDATVPTRMLGSTQVTLTSTATSSGTITNYQWTSSCGGTFGTPTEANTTFTSPAAAIQNTACVIRLTATDSCGRIAFDAGDTTILGLPDLAVTVTPSTTTPTVGSNLNYTITGNDVGGLVTTSSAITFTLPPSSQYAVSSITTSPSSIVCTPRVAPNTNVYDCPVGDLDGCSPVSIVVHGSVVTTGCFGVDVSGTTTSNDVDLGSNTANTQGCVQSSGDNPILIKSVSPASPSTVNPGGTLSYTLTLLNAGGTQLDNIHIYDPFPTATTTYVAGSSSVTYRSYLTTIADSFVAANFSGSTGQQPWAGNWTKINDTSTRATRGSVRVKNTNCAATYCPNITASINNLGLQRPLSLSGATSATLSFSYRVPTAKTGQTALVQSSGDGGTNWRTMATLSLATQVTTSTPVSYAFQTSELTANARIRFLTTGTSSAIFAADDISVQLQVAGTTVTSTGSTPAAGNTYDLTQNLNGLISLKPGESTTVTFRTTVNAGVSGGTVIANTANVKTTQTGATAIGSNTVNISTAASATSSPVAATQTVTLLEDVVAGNLGITAPTDADTTQANLTVLVKRLPPSTQATVYLADGVTPISVNQTLTVTQLTGLKLTGAPDFNGTADTFNYVVSDPQGNSSTGVTAATLTAVNDAPVTYPDQGSTQKGAAILLDPPGANDTDVDGLIDDSLCDLDPLTGGIQSTLTNASGTWTVDTDSASTNFGSVTYTPVASFTGVAAISYSSGDNGTPLPTAFSIGGSNCSTTPTGGCISVRVNAPPVATADGFTVNSIGGTFDVAANDTDSDGVVDVSAVDLDTVTPGIQTTYPVPGKGVFTSLLTGRVRFVPNSGVTTGTATVNYTIDDFDGGTSNSVAITVTIQGCSTAADCDDGNDCTSNACSAGACVNANLVSGSSCNDGNPSTRNDVCDGAGACTGAVYVCTPGPCESASVSNGTGCVGTPKADGFACDDGSLCTQTDTCQSGACTGSNPVVCVAGDECHDAGVCAPNTGVCAPATAKVDGTTCNDGNLCTQHDTCQSGSCTAGSPVVCTASDQCHDAGTCAPATGLCSSPPKGNGTTCNDSNACTQTDTCQSGTCTGGNPVTCTASDQCHDAGTCLPASGLCSSPVKGNGTGCDDGNACTQTDTCQSGTCTGGNPATCTASDQCHDAGTCLPASGLCSSPAKDDGTTCNDSNACTQTDTCQSGTCTGGNPVTCTASDQCHDVGTCAPGTGICSQPPKGNGTTCNDSNACTQTDTCQSGACTGGNPVTCTASDQCHDVGTCSPESGACSSPVKSDGTTCNDSNACTQTDICQSGACTGSNPVVCTAGDQCHDVGTCSPTTGTCSTPVKGDGTTCNDSNACTQTDTCQSGTCTGSNPITCMASDQCHEVGTCSPETGTCSTPAKANGNTCDDGNACTQTDSCQSGICTGTNPQFCSDPQKPSCDNSTGQCGCKSNSDCLVTAPICDAASHTCHGCLLDGDCDATQFCNTESYICVPKISNGTAVPTVASHTPNLVGQCSAAVAVAVCMSGVCATTDQRCGYPNAEGPCTVSNGSALCRSGVCDANDSMCGYADGDGPCTANNAATTCRSGLCSAGGSCLPPSACLIDGDCAATQFCNTETNLCAPKLANETVLPTISGHDPLLYGQCTMAVAQAVCISSVCNSQDDLCGFPNGDGPCTIETATTVCRSAVCDTGDSKCGFVNGDGPCTFANSTTVCRSRVCSVSGVCQAEGTCTVDGDCAATQFCNSETHLCASKLPNGDPVPTIGNHTPDLNGSCSERVGTAVCISSVCDTSDNQCGFANGDGPCAESNAAVLCRSHACDVNDSKCGYADGDGPCTKASASIACRSGVCSVSGVCQSPSSCTVDGDCEATQFCNTESRLCEPKLSNGSPMPSIVGHAPALDGQCTPLAGSVVCVSAVCDPFDNRCGFANGDGGCSTSNAATVCRSGACDVLDAKCGYLDGDGPCVTGTVCRSSSCSVSSVCQPVGACTVDGDCSITQFCDTQTRTCAPKLPNGTLVPDINGHTPSLNGLCSTPVAVAVCISSVCDTTDNECGYTNGVGPCTTESAALLCRSSLCDSSDQKCGYADGTGPCTPSNAATVCRSGSCSLSGVCHTAGTCAADADCVDTHFCNTETRTCSPKLPNGTLVPTIVGHTPTLDGACSAPAAAAVCISSICDSNDQRCGYANGDGPCTPANGALVCRSSVCDPSDSNCGYADGDGPCTALNASSVCRSGRCSNTGTCVSATGCHADSDCSAAQFCNTAASLCTARLSNGSALSTIDGHSPVLNGICSAEVGAAICQSGQCDIADNRCGLRDGSAPCTSDTAAICRSGNCTEGVCGLIISGSSGGSGAADAGNSSASSYKRADGTSIEGGGCACRMAKGRASNPMITLLLWVAGISVARRRRTTRARFDS